MAFFDIDDDEIEALLQEPEADIGEILGGEDMVQRGNNLPEVWCK